MFQPSIGTNTIAVSAAGLGADSFDLDMAMSTVAAGKVLLNTN